LIAAECVGHDCVVPHSGGRRRSEVPRSDEVRHGAAVPYMESAR